MGDPRKTRKHFKRPLKIWDRSNIEREKALKETYGLKNKREIWRTETMLRKKRHSARSLLALALEERLKRESNLLRSLARIGLLNEKATLDDVLTLNVESFLERRLQTLVWRHGLANTAKQARQFITHGHIAIAGRRVTAPGCIVTAEQEGKIGYYAGKKMVLKPVAKEKKPAKKKEGTEAEKKGIREEAEKKGIREEFEAAKPPEGKPAKKKEKKTKKEKKPAKEEKTKKEKNQPKKRRPKKKKGEAE